MHESTDSNREIRYLYFSVNWYYSWVRHTLPPVNFFY